MLLVFMNLQKEWILKKFSSVNQVGDLYAPYHNLAQVSIGRFLFDIFFSTSLKRH